MGKRVVSVPDVRILDGLLRFEAVVDVVGAIDGGIDAEWALSEFRRLGVESRDRAGQLSSGVKEKT